MKILVCVKQVPDMESRFRVAQSGVWYDTTDLAWRMNEYDEYSVEQAVRLKEEVGDADITILSIGPDKVKEAIKKGLAMGCDRGVHVADDEAGRKEPFAIASIIAAFARDKQFDLIFTGMQSQDRGSAQVGILVAEMLDMSGVSTVIDFVYKDGRVELKRELEGGVRAGIAIRLPALITCQLGLNKPRYPTLPNIMKAKKKELLSIPVQEFVLPEVRLQTAKIYFPEKRGGGLVLEGDPAELADRLLQLLREKTTVLS